MSLSKAFFFSFSVFQDETKLWQDLLYRIGYETDLNDRVQVITRESIIQALDVTDKYLERTNDIEMLNKMSSSVTPLLLVALLEG